MAPPKPDGISKLGFDPDGALAYGRRFLERFVQVPFSLPKLGAAGLEPLLEKLLGGPLPSASDTTAPSQAPDAKPDVSAPPATIPMPPSSSGGAHAPSTPPPPTESTNPNSPASEESLPASTRAAREARLREATDADSKVVWDVMRMAAPAFEANPRRLKQYLNLFRLGAHIASSTGLFDPPKKPGDPKPVTLQQLAKWLAIKMEWPAFLLDARRLPELWSAMLDDGVVPGTTVERWHRDSRLRELLAFGEPDVDFSMSDLDWSRFEVVAAVAPQAQSRTRGSEERFSGVRFEER